jgi:hypothetical protein
MARASEKILKVLRETTERILNSPDYQWGHMGACNCGHLAQVITMKSKAEIHKRAMYGIGDWNDQLNDYCPTSGMPFDEVIAEMLGFGFDIADLKHLERLSDPRVLARLPMKMTLKRNVKEDVAIYFTLWADMIEEVLEKEKVLA